MDNHKLIMIPIDWFLYSSKYDKNTIFIFHKKTCMKILEFSYIHTNKTYFLIFLNFEENQIFFNIEFVSYNINL
jgi:hypothetical protein